MNLNFYELLKSQLDLMEKSDYCNKLNTKKISSGQRKRDFNYNQLDDFEECWQKLQDLCQQAMQSLELQHQPHH